MSVAKHSNPQPRAGELGSRPCVNSSPHAGHFIRSKSIRCISAGVMTFPHFGHTVLSDALTFSRLIFRARGMVLDFENRDLEFNPIATGKELLVPF